MTMTFEITEIDKNIGLKLAVTPLTESRDKFLCVVLQLPPEMRTFGSETTAVICRYLVLQDHQFFRHVIHSPIPLLFPSQTISEEIH
jgi:hypothetical protein